MIGRAFYDLWIEKISRDSTEDVVVHIKKHFKELKTTQITRDWIISLINLALIAEKDFNITTDEEVERLYKHGKKHPQEFEKDFIEVYEELKKKEEYENRRCRKNTEVI